jgi:integrase/recombinase XerD
MTFDEYLQSKRYSPETIASYCKGEAKLSGWLLQEQIAGEEATYTDVLAFMRYLQDMGRSKRTVHSLLNVVRHYFIWLIAEGRREDNPAAGVYVRGIVRKLPGNLLSMDEMEELYRCYQLQLNVDLAKKLMLGLLIYQGLQTEEFMRLEGVHIQLKEGRIFVKGTSYSNERWLPLQAQQVVDWQQYLQANKFKEGIFLARPVRKDASARNISNRMQHMIVQLRRLNPKVINANQLRNSVISFWLQRYNLRQVQYMAGHKYVSSTERYQRLNKDDLQSELQKHHLMS